MKFIIMQTNKYAAKVTKEKRISGKMKRGETLCGATQILEKCLVFGP